MRVTTAEKTVFKRASLALLLLFSAAQGLRAQSIGLDRQRGNTTLNTIKSDLKSNYYDSKFRGVDLDARFKVAAQQIGKPATDQDIDIVRVETRLVVLPVRVTVRGKTVFGLSREQFRVFEDGVEQAIAYFEGPADPNNPSQDSSSGPLTLALMLDVSDSTEFKLKQIQSTAIAFVDLLRPIDRLILLAFDKGARFLTEATADRDALRRAIGSLRTGGGTSLHDALNVTIARLNQFGGRKSIVLLTDGVDTSSKNATAESVLRAAEQSYISIYPIQYDTYGDFSDAPSRETYVAGEIGKTAHVTKTGEFASEAYKRATLYLRMLADRTAGRFQFAAKTKDLASSFESIAEQLRRQYTIGYYPKNKSTDGKLRRIKVDVSLPDVTATTRKSYLYK